MTDAVNNKERLEQAFEEYSDALFRHCFFRLSSHERATELTQECFLKTWDYLEQGNTIVSIRPFLYRVLNNLIIDEYRKKTTHSLDALLEEDGVSEGNFDELRGDSREEAIVRFDASRIHEALSSLPETYREVVTLRFIDGLSPKEIARFLDEPENAVSVRIHRGIKKLRLYFQDYEQ